MVLSEGQLGVGVLFLVSHHAVAHEMVKFRALCSSGEFEQSHV